jgi:hypothetical protein
MHMMVPACMMSGSICVHVTVYIYIYIYILCIHVHPGIDLIVHFYIHKYVYSYYVCVYTYTDQIRLDDGRHVHTYVYVCSVHIYIHKTIARRTLAGSILTEDDEETNAAPSKSESEVNEDASMVDAKENLINSSTAENIQGSPGGELELACKNVHFTCIYAYMNPIIYALMVSLS